MARTPTIQTNLGYKALAFTLPDAISGEEFSFESLKGEKGTAVLFICNHCPFVIHIIEEVVSIVNEYQEKGIGFVVISSNDVLNYPDDSPEKMKEFATKYSFTFPYLYDETQEVAKAYVAACTPDISVFDNNSKCVYRGQLDGSRPGNQELNDGKDIRKVLDYIISDKILDFEQVPSVGCGIKWKVD